MPLDASLLMPLAPGAELQPVLEYRDTTMPLNALLQSPTGAA